MWHAWVVDQARQAVAGDRRQRARDQRRRGTSCAEPLRADWRPRSGDQNARERKTHRSAPPRAKRHRSLFGRLVATYGWRIYALPVLMVVTVLVVLDLVNSPATQPTDQATAANDVVSGGPPAATENPVDPVQLDIPTAELPGGGDFSTAGDGSWHVVPGGGEKVGDGQQVYTYTVEVEDGIDPSSYAGDKSFAASVQSTLSDPRSWIGSGQVSFQRVDASVPDPDLRLSLTTPETTHRADICGYSIKYESSCYRPDSGRVVINLARWVRGAMAFNGDVGLYRQYVINHEVGHALGNGHVGCAEDGGLAPVMMQQTFGVANDYVAKLNGAAENGDVGPVPADGKVCRPNAWPNPQARPPR